MHIKFQSSRFIGAQISEKIMHVMCVILSVDNYAFKYFS